MGGNLAKLIRASRGPVLLMTLGALLAVNQFTGYSFDQTFPVLIIVFGMMWLLERMAPRHLDTTVVGGANTIPSGPQQRAPLMEAEQPYDPLADVHRRVYGDVMPRPSSMAAGAMPPRAGVPIDPRELPTAEHPIRQQAKANPENKGGSLL